MSFTYISIEEEKKMKLMFQISVWLVMNICVVTYYMGYSLFTVSQRHHLISALVS